MFVHMWYSWIWTVRPWLLLWGEQEGRRQNVWVSSPTGQRPPINLQLQETTTQIEIPVWLNVHPTCREVKTSNCGNFQWGRTHRSAAQVGQTELDPIISVSCNFRQRACCVYKPLIWFHAAVILSRHTGRSLRCVLSQPYLGELLKRAQGCLFWLNLGRMVQYVLNCGPDLLVNWRFLPHLQWGGDVSWEITEKNAWCFSWCDLQHVSLSLSET